MAFLPRVEGACRTTHCVELRPGDAVLEVSSEGQKHKSMQGCTILPCGDCPQTVLGVLSGVETSISTFYIMSCSSICSSMSSPQLSEGSVPCSTSDCLKRASDVLIGIVCFLVPS